MTDYVMRLLSYYHHSPEILNLILRLPTLGQLIFPAVLHIAEDNSLLLKSAEQFDLSLIPQMFWNETGLSLSLYGENGVELYTTIKTKIGSNPNVLGLRFRSKQLEENVINLSIFKALFEEVTPVFQVDTGAIYDKQTSRRINPIYPSKKDTPKSKRYFKDSRGKQHTFGIYWINYFGKYVLDSLDRERFTELHTYSEKYELHDGIMLILQNFPYDDNNYEHRQRQIQAEAELYFSENLSS